MNKKMKRVHLIISGDVQGVGFRAWAKRSAQRLHLTGWVKNREDEAVEIIAEGEQRDLKNFILLCHTGPDVAWVSGVTEKWQDASNEFSGFEVIY